MVKADIKRNYYGDLELPNDATLEDIKKQYRKLAFKYHPDRNPGKETEIVSKFQAIQFAYEILEDPATKAKYDADRRKAGLVPLFGRSAASASRAPPPNPYGAAASPFPPPPRRNATTSGQSAGWRPAPAAAGGAAAGADRFANFPKPAPTSKRDSDKANVFTAWQNMNQGRKDAAGAQQQQQQPRPQPRGAFGASPQKPRPAAPPRQDTRRPTGPTEEEIRAGTRYHQAPAGAFSDRARAQWQDFNTSNVNKPGMARSNTTRTPKKPGFDPMAGGDEGQAGSTANYSSSRARTRSDDARTYPPPPPRPSEAPPMSQNNSGEHDAPYTENIRVKTPYSSHIGQQKYTSSDDLRRSHSAREFAQGPPNPKTTTPPGIPLPKQTYGSSRRPFVVEDDSSNDSVSDEGSSATTPENNQSHNKPNPDLSTDPFLRPKRVPIPPSSRTASPFKQTSFESTTSSGFSGSNKADVGDRGSFNTSRGANPTQQQQQQQQQSADKSKDTMYEHSLNHPRDPFPLSKPRNSIPTTPWTKFGPWAVPSTLLPSKRAASALQQNPETSRKVKSDSGAAYTVGSSSTMDPAPYAQKEEKDISYNKCDSIRKMSLEDLRGLHTRAPPLCSNSKRRSPPAAAHDQTYNTGFSFPISSDTFAPTSGDDMRSRSTENINTKFTASQWAGTFSANNVFAAPVPPVGKPSSPARKSSRILRSQTSGLQSAQAAFGEGPWSQYAAKTPETVPQAPASPPQQPVKFDASEWAKTMKDPTWAFQPESLRTDSSRPASRGRNASAKPSGVKVPVTTPRRATAAAVEDKDEQGANGQASTHRSSQAQAQSDTAEDLMDIDMEGVSPGPSVSIPPATAPTTNPPQKEPRFVQVDPSSLRQSSKRHSKGPTLKANLDDLGSVLSEPADGEGLTSLKGMSSNLPFPSKASATHPTQSYAPRPIDLPKLPIPPEQMTTRPTKQMWRAYCDAFSRYLKKYHAYSNAMQDHFNTRRQLTAELDARGSSELMSVGAEKWLEYNQAVEEDMRVRYHWDIGCEKHAEAVKGFTAVRQRIAVLSEGAGLPDV